jgi:hypothetical protein
VSANAPAKGEALQAAGPTAPHVSYNSDGLRAYVDTGVADSFVKTLLTWIFCKKWCGVFSNPLAEKCPKTKREKTGRGGGYQAAR